MYIDKIIKKLLEHDDAFAKVQKQVVESEDRILTAIDNLSKKTINAEVEQMATRATLARHEKDITKIKKVFKIA